MPLTSLNKVHRTFPSIFAEKMSQHVKQRTQSYKQYRCTSTQDEDIVLEPLDDAEISEMCDSDGEVSKNSLGHSHSRLTPEMSMLKTFNLNHKNNNSESESDASSNTTTPRPGSSRPSTSPSPRGNARSRILESPRPQATNFVPVFSPRRPRQSPRTTGSLDNVDLWEESDNDSNDFDNVEGVMIDPLKTFDFSELRRSKSPVACKRNKLSWNVPHKPDTEHKSCKSRASPREKSRDKQHNAARARAARRLKQIFPNPAVSKPAPRLHIAKPSTNTVVDKDNLKPVSTAKMKLLPQRESRIAAKFPAIAIQDNESKQKLDLPKDKKTVLNEYNLRNKQQLDKIPQVNSDKQINKQTEKHTNKPDKQMPPIKCSDNKGITEDKQKLKDSSKPYKPELYKDNSAIQKDNSPNSTMEEPSVTRKVKFNSFVTVRDDQVNTLDFLKHSNNSAQMFKNKFLRNPNMEHPPSEICRDDGDSIKLMLQTIS